MEILRIIPFRIKRKLKIENRVPNGNTRPLKLICTIPPENTTRQILYRKIRILIVGGFDPAFEIWIVGFVNFVHKAETRPVGSVPVSASVG